MRNTIEYDQGFYFSGAAYGVATLFLTCAVLPTLPSYDKTLPWLQNIIAWRHMPGGLIIITMIAMAFSRAIVQVDARSGAFRRGLRIGSVRLGKWHKVSAFRFAVIQKFRVKYSITSNTDIVQPIAVATFKLKERFSGIFLYPKQRSKERKLLLEAPIQDLHSIAKLLLAPNDIPVYNGGPKPERLIRFKTEANSIQSKS